ncbi:MAG: beta-glucosidase BglX, partial [Chitinophagaceae bacterium]
MKKRTAVFFCFLFLHGIYHQASGQGMVHSQILAKNADSNMDHFISQLMDKMTLEEKIGQLNLLTSDMAVTGPTMQKDYLDQIKRGDCGAIFNAYTPAFVKSLQDLAVRDTRLHIPLIFGFDVIHGFKTIFPIPLAMASSWDLQAIQQSARIAATEASADGLNWTFSPMVDISRDPRWGRVMEGAGEDPYLGSQIAKVMVRGYQDSDLSRNNVVMACVKHFALYGAVEGGREYNTVDMSRRRMFEIYFPPYKAAVDAGVGSVMTSFNEVDGIPATGNRWLQTDVLRKMWGFKGFVVTDYTSINEMINHGVAANTYQAGELAMNAGVDMDMQGQVYVHQLPRLIQNKKISIHQVNQAVRRVLEAKYKLGLFKDPYHDISVKRAATEIMNPAELQAAEWVAGKSIVLLKNDHQLLPLAKKGTLAVIGPLADDQRDMIGAWSGAGDWQQSVSILQGIKNSVGNQAKILYAKGANITDDTNLLRQLNANGGDIVPDKKSPEELIQEAVETARKADVVILTLGESEGMTGEAASRSDIRLLKNQRRLMKAVYATGKPIVLLLSNGRPLVLDWPNRHIPAILETWFLGTQAGNAIADVLFGKVNPSGKLTMSFPVSVGQIPVYYDHKNTGRPMNPLVKYTSKYLDIPDAPLYPFGFGLSYTHFTFGPLLLN